MGDCFGIWAPLDPRPHYALPPSLPSLAHTRANARGDAPLHHPRTQRVQPKLRSGSFKRRHPHLVPSFEALQSKSMVNLAVTTSPSSPDISDPETGSPSPLSPRVPLSPESHSPQLYRPHFICLRCASFSLDHSPPFSRGLHSSSLKTCVPLTCARHIHIHSVRPASADGDRSRGRRVVHQNHAYRHHRISRGSISPSALVESSDAAEDIRKLWSANLSTLPSIPARQSPTTVSNREYQYESVDDLRHGEEDIRQAMPEESSTTSTNPRHNSLPRNSRSHKGSNPEGDNAGCMVESPEPILLHRADVKKLRTTSASVDHHDPDELLGCASDPNALRFYVISRRLKPWLKRRTDGMTANTHPPRRGDSGPSVAPPCSVCYVVRTGGGFLTMG